MAGERLYFSEKSLVSGHNVYKHIWIPGIGEELSVDKEPSNLHDNFALSAVFIYLSFMDRLKSRATVSLVFSSTHLTAFNLKLKSCKAIFFDIAINEHAR